MGSDTRHFLTPAGGSAPQPGEVQPYIQAATNLLKFFTEGDHHRISTVERLLALACRRAAEEVGGAPLDVVLASDEVDKIEAIRKLAETGFAEWGDAQDETRWLLGQSFGTIALMCHHRFQRLSGKDLEILKLAVRLYATVKYTQQDQ